jgi:c-opsin
MGRPICILTGFIMFSIGTANIYILTALSIERLYVATRFKKKRSFRSFLGIIGVCVGLALAWSTMPLLGWSKYSTEVTNTSCCVEWNEKSSDVISYNVTIFLTIFLLPLVFIFVANYKLILFVSYLKLLKFLLLNFYLGLIFSI